MLSIILRSLQVPPLLLWLCGSNCVLDAESLIVKKWRQKVKTNPRGPRTCHSTVLRTVLWVHLLATQSGEGRPVYIGQAWKRCTLLLASHRPWFSHLQNLTARRPEAVVCGTTSATLNKQLVSQNLVNVQKLEAQHFGSPRCKVGLKTGRFARSFIRYSCTLCSQALAPLPPQKKMGGLSFEVDRQTLDLEIPV